MDISALGYYKTYFFVIVVLVVLDVVLGIASAIKMKRFKAELMASFLAQDVLPFIVGLAAFIVALNLTTPDLSGVSAAFVVMLVSIVAWVMVVISLSISVIKSVSEIVAAPVPVSAPKA